MKTHQLAVATLLGTSLCFAVACSKPKQETKKKVAKVLDQKPATKKADDKPADPAGAGGEPAAAGGKGTVKGTVAFKGAAPAAKKLDMSKDPACKKINPKGSVEEVAVKDGKLANVLVHVKVPKGKYGKNKNAAVIDQKGCVYVPLVTAVQANEEITIINSDPLLHNVHAYAKPGEFNLAMPKQGMKLKKKIKRAQLNVEVKCEVHPWMLSWLHVVPDPFFAVTKADGTFEIGDVPAGEYDVEFVHPILGTQEKKLKVAADTKTDAMVEFAAK